MKKLLITTALCCAATGAAAELTYGAAFAKYHNLDGDGGDLDVTTLGGAAEFRAGQFTFSGDFGNIDVDDGDFTFGSIGAGYLLQNGVTLGLDYTRFDLGDGDDLDLTAAYAFYSFGAYTIGVTAGDSSADEDDEVYGVFGAWDVSDTGTVGFDLVRVGNENLLSAYADYDLAQYSLEADLFSVEDLNIVSLRGTYDLGNAFSLHGAVSVADLDGDDITTLAVGAGYEFAPGAKLEVEIARTDLDDAGDFDRLTVGIDYEFGKRTSKRRTLGGILATNAQVGLGLQDF